MLPSTADGSIDDTLVLPSTADGSIDDILVLPFYC